MAASGSEQAMVGKMMVFTAVVGVGVGGGTTPRIVYGLDVLGLRVVL